LTNSLRHQHQQQQEMRRQHQIIRNKRRVSSVPMTATLGGAVIAMSAVDELKKNFF